MSTAFSQDFVQADRLIRRRYVQIPRKQKELLERPDAWSENLSHGPRGMINVPPEVLQDVKDFHSRRHSKPTQEPIISQPASPAASGIPPMSTRTKQPLSSPRLGRDEQDGDDEATQLSWSPSPSRPPPGRRPVQTIKQPELVSSPTIQPASWSASLESKTPPGHSAVGPPSSAAQSDALPYEPPAMLGPESHPPVNRGANRVTATQSIRPVATPPSAQAEIIPRTLSKIVRVGGAAERPVSKRRRTEEVELPDREQEPTQQTRPSPESDSKPTSAAPQIDRNASRASISTPSFPSPTAVEEPQNGSSLQTAPATNSNQRSSSHYTPTYEGRPRGTPSQQKNVLRHTASGSSMAPAPAQPRVYSTHVALVKEPQSHVGNTFTPYGEFKAAYPDYEESTRAFIRACLAVEKLECERALPEFLYDDFVRVHSTVYMDYFELAQQGKASEVLKATQWYSENVKDMVYTKKIIRRDNLHAILEAHSTAVQQVRESIREAIPSTEDADSNEESDEDMGDDIKQAPGMERTTKESEPDDTSGSRLSPEFQIASPGPTVTASPSAFGNDDMGEIEEPYGSASASPMRQQTERSEDDLDGSPQNDKAASENSHRSSASPELNFQEPGTVLDEELPMREVIQAVERTSPSRKSPNPGQSLRNASTAANPATKAGSGQGTRLAPLPSSPPSSAMGSAKRVANDKALFPSLIQTIRQSSPAFRSQAESSDDESNSFDPPIATAAMPPSRSAESDAPAFLTQPQSVYEIPGTPDRLSEEPMPPPPPQSRARTSAGHKPRSVQGQAASIATTATALNPDAAAQKQVIVRERPVSRSPIASSIGAMKGPASSARPRASVPLFKKREGETKEERSKRLKEHIRKRLSGKTPGSTPASTK